MVALALTSYAPSRPGNAAPDPSQHAAAHAPPASAVLTREAALALAKAEVARQPKAARYLSDSLVVIDSGDRWEVRVPREGGPQTRPTYGLFFIEKATGEIQWVPQR